MPIIQQSSYPKPPFYLSNGHLQTIIPALTRKVEGIRYERERLELSDGDFVDLDWVDKGSKNLILLTHGLEGNSSRHYILGMAKWFSDRNWDALAWNCRSCSGEMNRNLRLYNHGEIEDIGEIIQHAIRTKAYEKIVLVGFSMGGNITMKYLGVQGKDLPEPVAAGIAFSSPVDLTASVKVLEDIGNRMYKNYFLKNLEPKIKHKAAQHPDILDFENFKKIKVWKDFDDYFSAPINGYESAEAFYHQASAKNFMQDIQVPALLLNAQNDPLLTPECSPKEFCEQHPYIYLETPKYGGHVGFSWKGKPYAWSEYRAWEFVEEVLS